MNNKSIQSILRAILVMAVLSVSVISCKKDKSEDDDSTIIKENSSADAAFSDVANISDEAYDGTLSSYRLESSARVYTTCATITFDTVSTPKSFTVDFGTTDCLCNDGNYRRGKIIVTFQGHYRDSGSVHTITFDNYYQNYNKIDGTKTVTNTGRNGNGQLTFSISVAGTITWDAQYGGGTSTYQSTRTRTWIAGESTKNIWIDDVYEISGTVNGVTRGGTAYTMVTQTPLRAEIGFRHFTQGVLDFTPGTLATRSIDYGFQNGARDNLARVTVNGTTFTVVLR